MGHNFKQKLMLANVLKASSYDCQSLAVPNVRWLGILPSDIDRLQIPAASLLPLNESDRRKLRSLLERPYCRLPQSPLAEALSLQLRLLQNLGVKAEIQSLCAFSPRFLCSTYVPTKIGRGSWI